jgi:hypothetical protein
MIDLLTAAEATKALGVSYFQLKSLAKRGLIKSVANGSRFPKYDLGDYPAKLHAARRLKAVSTECSAASSELMRGGLLEPYRPHLENASAMLFALSKEPSK